MFRDQSNAYPTGIIQFAQTRTIEAGASMRLKLNPTTIVSIQADIFMCGENVMPDTMTGHPIVFHASFDNVSCANQKRRASFFFFFFFFFGFHSPWPQTADGSGGTILAGSSSHEVQLLSDAEKFKEGQASVVAHDCNTPAPTPTWDGISAFRHPVLNNASDCITISVLITPQSLTLSHSRDPINSRTMERFDTLFDVVSRSSCCTIPEDMSCPSRSIDDPYWLSFNQVIVVPLNNDPGRLHRQSNRGKRVDLTITTLPATSSPVSSNAIGTDGSNGAGDDGVASWVIAVIVVAVLLVLGIVAVIVWVMYSRKKRNSHVNFDDDATLRGGSQTPQSGYSQPMFGNGTTLTEPSSAVADAPPSTISNPETVQLARQGSQPGGGDVVMSGYTAVEHEQLRRSGIAESAKNYAATDAMFEEEEKPAY
jgi:hypothetical protein